MVIGMYYEGTSTCARSAKCWVSPNRGLPAPQPGDRALALSYRRRAQADEKRLAAAARPLGGEGLSAGIDRSWTASASSGLGLPPSWWGRCSKAAPRIAVAAHGVHDRDRRNARGGDVAEPPEHLQAGAWRWPNGSSCHRPCRDQLIEQVVLWSHTARKEGLLALENLIPTYRIPHGDSNCWSMASSRSACRRSWRSRSAPGRQMGNSLRGCGKGGRLRADERDPGRGAGPHPCDGEPLGSGQAGKWHRGRIRRHDLRCRPANWCSCRLPKLLAIIASMVSKNATWWSTASRNRQRRQPAHHREPPARLCRRLNHSLPRGGRDFGAAQPEPEVGHRMLQMIRLVSHLLRRARHPFRRGMAVRSCVRSPRRCWRWWYWPCLLLHRLVDVRHLGVGSTPPGWRSSEPRWWR